MDFLLHQIEHGVIQHKVIYMAEVGILQGSFDGGHAVSVEGMHILVAHVGEVAIAEVNILTMAVGSALDHGHLGGEGMNAAEVDIPDGGAHAVFVNLQADGVEVDPVHGDIGEGQILD